jgi:Fur family ferric uptake transcriptional regulator
MAAPRTVKKHKASSADVLRKKEALRSFLKEKGFKSTRQRDIIAHEFLIAGEHMTSEELYNRVSKKHREIGHTTVYRTLKLLKKSGLATERVFADNLTRYEPITPDEHHDHLICLKCGSITEFEDSRLERLQQKIAEGFGFNTVSHKMELYGYCKECGPAQKKR